MTYPIALYADSKGEIYDAPGYQAVGRNGLQDVFMTTEDLIPLPEGSELMLLPGRSVLAGLSGESCVIADSLLAVAAVLPVGYTRTLLPAYKRCEDAPLLPLYGYAAVAGYKGRMYVAAVKSDNNEKWHPYRYNTAGLAKKIDKVKKDLQDNRLVQHLANCSLEWHCCTAQNLFYHRWEAGIPVSPACNADCLGCISLQPAECCQSPQNRIKFVPSVREISEIACYHLADAPEPIVSFGQGCEGEPSLAADTIAAAIKQVRSTTSRGVINMNTNAGNAVGLKLIVDAGIDSIRVSLISARPEIHKAYYRPNYLLDDVKESIRCAKSKGVFVSINMLLLPGLNDRPEELAAWSDFIADTGIDMIQLRNLNIDPDIIWQSLPGQLSQPVGVKTFIAELRKCFPALKIGNFSRYIGDE